MHALNEGSRGLTSSLGSESLGTRQFAAKEESPQHCKLNRKLYPYIEEASTNPKI